jgi:hypothetical protein
LRFYAGKETHTLAYGEHKHQLSETNSRRWCFSFPKDSLLVHEEMKAHHLSKLMDDNSLTAFLQKRHLRLHVGFTP